MIINSKRGPFGPLFECLVADGTYAKVLTSLVRREILRLAVDL